MPTKIEWTNETWNPITGCDAISDGCLHCYAKRMATRLAGRYGYPKDEPFKVTFHPDKLSHPSKWKKPRKVFVCSMGDLFHEDVTDEMLIKVFNVIRANIGTHTFLILTKRPKRMADVVPRLRFDNSGDGKMWLAENETDRDGYPIFGASWHRPSEHCNNLWLGVTAENQQAADERIPLLLQIPAKVRFVSVEPMLERVDLSKFIFPMTGCDHYIKKPTAGQIFEGYTSCFRAENASGKCCPEYCPFGVTGLSWVICGAETGSGARNMNQDWAWDLKEQCKKVGMPFFFKKTSEGSHRLFKQEYEEFPDY